MAPIPPIGPSGPGPMGNWEREIAGGDGEREREKREGRREKGERVSVSVVEEYSVAWIQQSNSYICFP